MSGGVDSSVTARLLMDKVRCSLCLFPWRFSCDVQGYDLSAIFMRNWDTRDESGTDEGCEWKKDWHDVQRVCKMLDIPCKLVSVICLLLSFSIHSIHSSCQVDLSKEYWNRVFQPALAIWEMGGTPNPDIWCNR